MGKIKKYKNIVERMLSGEKGQRFFNFAYSIGAAIVILGALFKILHLDGGNEMLCIGMGTEVVMFVLTAFDRPEKDYNWERVFPVLESGDPEDRPDFASGEGIVIGSQEQEETSEEGEAFEPSETPEETDAPEEFTADIPTIDMPQIADPGDAPQQFFDQMRALAEQMQSLGDSVTQSTNGYVEQMDSLSRNIAGLNTIYEIQLKSISSQIDTIDRVNRGLKDIRDMYEKSAAESANYCDETEKMARYMKQLNSVYEKMIKAMTVNMYRPMGGMAGLDPDNTDEA